MTPRAFPFRKGLPLALIVAVLGPRAFGQDPVGLLDLRARYGASLPQGNGIVGWMTEADVSVATGGGQVWGAYWPDLNNPAVVGSRTITLYGLPTQIAPVPPPNIAPPSLLTFSSSHATDVAGRWFAGPGSVSPDLSSVVFTSAGYFLGSAALRTQNGTTAPVIDPHLPVPSVINASWIGAYNQAAINTDVLRRADYLVDRMGVNLVVGVDNAGGVTPTVLMGQGYNSISVGLSNGGSAGGLSTVDGAGRVLIDVVVPVNATSYAAPIVSGTATLIADRAQETPSLSNAADPRVVRSLIMTGAEKLAGWSNTATRPTDLQQGAGELRINRTYDILMSGEKLAGSLSYERGWDLAETTAGVQYYFVENPYEGGNLSVTLTWNRVTGDVGDPDGTNPTSLANFTTMDGFTVLSAGAMADLDLAVFTADPSNTPLLSLASSDSGVDNVEHIFLKGVGAGRYAIAVGGGAGTTYGLSFTFVPETNPAWPLSGVGLAGLAWVAWRRRAAGGGN